MSWYDYGSAALRGLSGLYAGYKAADTVYNSGKKYFRDARKVYGYLTDGRKVSKAYNRTSYKGSGYGGGRTTGVNRVRRPRRIFRRRVRRVRRRKFGGKGLSKASVLRMIRSNANWSPVQEYSRCLNTQLSTAANQKTAHQLGFDSLSDISEYFDSCNPTTVNGTTVTWQNITDQNNKIKLLPSFAVYTFANNWSFTCHLDMYFMKCVSNTDSNALNTMRDVLDTYFVDSAQAAVTNAEIYFGWSFKQSLPMVKSTWRCRKHVKVILHPGETKTIRFPIDAYTFTAQNISNNFLTSTNLKGITHALVLQQWGQVAHDDATTTNIGYSTAAVDVVYQYRRRFKVYAPQSPVKKTIQVETFGTLTNPATVNVNVKTYDTIAPADD